MTAAAYSNVLRLVFENGVGEHYRVDADALLMAAMGHRYKRLLVIGELEEPDEAGDPDLYVAGTHAIDDMFILMELAKRFLV